MNLNDVPVYDYSLIYDFMFSNNDVYQFNNLSELLGYKKNDKLLMIHTDDLGLSNSVNQASFEALNNKYMNSASVMIPVPCSNEVADYFKENPDMDLGLHLYMMACHSWSSTMSHFHHGFLKLPWVKSLGVKSPFNVGCYYLAISGWVSANEGLLAMPLKFKKNIEVFI